MDAIVTFILLTVGVVTYGGGFFILYLFPGYCAFKLLKKESHERPKFTIFLGLSHSIISVAYLAYLVIRYWGKFGELGMWGVVFAIPIQIPSLIFILFLTNKYGYGTSNKRL